MPVENAIQNAQVIRFGTFEVDLNAGEVRKGGVKLKLSGQPFQVLVILLEQHGKVVTREQLQQRLWPDTFVDVDHNLNTAINKIREALGDSTENPRFVETLHRRGYRLIGQIATPVLPVILIEPDHVKPPRTIWLKIAPGILATLVCTAGVGVAYR